MWNPKILIIGSGGIGGYYGGRLAQHGYDVCFLARGEHYKAICDNGLKVSSIAGDFHVKPAKAISSLAEAGCPDVILFCVKTYDTEILSTELNRIVSENTIIISVQNGIDNDKLISRFLHKGKIFPGLAHIISTKTGPGQIAHTAASAEIIFGDRSNPENPELLQIESIMENSGINAKASRAFEIDEWRKFILITSFAGMTSAYRTSIGGILEDQGRFELYKQSIRESVAVAKAYAVNLEADIYEQIVARAEAYRGVQAGAKSSMLKDIEAGRSTEIESLNGTIVRLGKELGVATPVHERIRDAIISGKSL